ncbi:MAG TPA: alpha/beta fold hydrolase [Polyangia bacterium]|jgi:polyhydroxyalkanoate synthase
MTIAPTPRDPIYRDGTAQLYRFRRPATGPAEAGLPLLLVPSLINRWYVMDLRPRQSLVEALVGAGVDTWCLDWGKPNDEDRYLAWDEIFDRLGRMVRRVKRATGAPRVGLLGYCMGGTLSGIYTALAPHDVAALINLLGPFDFDHGGFLAHVAQPRWFDAEAVAAAGNVSPHQLQSSFLMLRPTGQMSKLVSLLELATKPPEALEGFVALETWANDGIPFPAAAYVTYIKELYQENRLVRGTHAVRGQRVDLGAIRCPVLTVCAEKDTICPPAAARALNEHCGSADQQVLMVPGGHVGAVVGSKAVKVLYPGISAWLREKLAVPAAA